MKYPSHLQLHTKCLKNFEGKCIVHVSINSFLIFLLYGIVSFRMFSTNGLLDYCPQQQLDHLQLNHCLPVLQRDSMVSRIVILQEVMSKCCIGNLNIQRSITKFSGLCFQSHSSASKWCIGPFISPCLTPELKILSVWIHINMMDLIYYRKQSKDTNKKILWSKSKQIISIIGHEQ